LSRADEEGQERLDFKGMGRGLRRVEAEPSTVLASGRRTRYDENSAHAREGRMEPTWHDGLSRRALVELVEGMLSSMDRAVSRLDAVAHHLSLMAQQQGDEASIIGGIADQAADLSDELYQASDRERLREWGNQIDTPDKAH
jgi:hypothetical protein